MQELVNEPPVVPPDQFPDEYVVFNGHEYFRHLIYDIQHATRTIDLEVYIYEDDSIGREVAHHLASAARRGVLVRLLVDGFGSPFWGGHLADSLERTGVKIRVYHPIPWNPAQWKYDLFRSNWFLRLFRLLVTLNNRNHRKTCIIDGKIAWVGSFNIEKRHLPKEEGGEDWRDTAVRFHGTGLEELRGSFEQIWNLGKGEILERRPLRVLLRSRVRLNLSWRARRRLQKDLLKRVRQTRQRIWVTNAYFVPDNALLKCIQERAQQGVDVRILLPGKSDVFFIPWASQSFYTRLIRSGARVYEYGKGMLHSKTLLLDDWAIVGTSNLNHRSLLHDLEVDIELTREGSIRRLREQFMSDLEYSAEIQLDDLRKRSALTRVLGRALLYLKNWL